MNKALCTPIDDKQLFITKLFYGLGKIQITGESNMWYPLVLYKLVFLYRNSNRETDWMLTKPYFDTLIVAKTIIILTK